LDTMHDYHAVMVVLIVIKVQLVFMGLLALLWECWLRVAIFSLWIHLVP